MPPTDSDVPTAPSIASPTAGGDAPCPLATSLAHRLREARDELTTRWLERIVDRVSLDERRVFPSDELLDHVPILIDGVADFVERPSYAVGADSAVVAKAMELGALRHQQGFDTYQVLKEYEILGGILFNYLAGIVEEVPLACSRADLFSCAHRVYRAIALVQQATTTEYLRRVTDKLSERDARLRSFHRTLAHELRNRIGAAGGAAELLESVDLGETVTLFGPGDAGEPTIADWAGWAETIEHEIVTGIGSRVTRTVARPTHLRSLS